MRIGEIYDKIDKGEIPVEEELKQAILSIFTHQGIEKVKNQTYWSREEPILWITRMTQLIEENLREKKTHERQEMGEEELEFYRKIYVRFYRIRRTVKNLLKQENEEE